MDSQKGRLILGGIVLIALAAIMLYMYSDVLFSGRENAPANPNAAAANSAVGGNAQPEPDAPSPPPRGGGRMVAPTGK